MDNGGFPINGVDGVAAGGFTEMFYMRNYCWEHMTHYPVMDFVSNKTNGIVIQVEDKTRPEEIHNLTFIKIFPYFLMGYCLVMTIPYLIFSHTAAENVKIQVDFLMSGFEEGLTMTIGGLAKMMDNNERLQKTKDEDRVYDGLECELKKVF